MIAREGVTSQRMLFEHHGAVFDPTRLVAFAAYEAQWVGQLITALPPAPPVRSFKDFRATLNTLIESDAATPSPSEQFLAREASRTQFRVIVEQFAVDGLTEAQAFLAILPRLPLRAQAAVQRILIDEFGCGNVEMMHTQLYCNLLRELGSPIELEPFVASALDPVFEFVNIFHWMTKRAHQVDYFLGALAWFEGVVPTLFAPYVAACERLGIHAHPYYSEHVHIDVFHARSALLAISETARVIPFDYQKAWTGVRLAHATASRAFEAAVSLARSCTP
ncbi:iron-containing redox enzyme family protein [Burkholderia sp. Bp9012]|uniref:iron-containing redox enzyme family protein n=1 Tax=Burkholderia sp. Bp9012 TaxID=2184562 RepID=UPI000F59F4E4|nr:iron-containing redox enzyme family protein [Burkholderia sp. Bp9012]RQR79132.1 iron-containing redox enzyme family protein [Burkholderia sp. Bp9012]